MAFLVNGVPIITNDRDLSAVGVATLTEDINIGRLLYDATGQVGAANSVLVTKDNTLQWVAPSAIGIATGSSLSPGSTYFVTENGDDGNTGDSINNAWASVAHALANITVSGDDALYISAGDYTETFPLTVPAGLTIKGAGQRATTIRPTSATETENGFLLNNDTTIEDLTIGAMFKPQGATNYAFSYESGAALTTRGPYISRVSIVNKGSNVTAADPYGYNSADNYPASAPGAAGFLADGSLLDASTTSASMLLNEVTAFPVGNIGIDMVNGTRMEVLNSFVYFASEGIKGRTDLAEGLAGDGRTRLSLENPSSAAAAAETIQYFDTDGTTVLASGTIDEVSGSYVYLSGSGTGSFTVPRNNTPVAVNFVGDAELSNTQVKFGTASLDATATQSDAVTAESSGFGFGTGDLTIEGWFYFGALNNGRVLLDMRSTAATDSAISVRESGTDLEVFVGSTSILVTSGVTITTGAWFHVAVTRAGTSLKAFINGTEVGSATNSDDLGLSAPLHLGANYQDSNGVNAYIDDFRIEKGVAKYTGAFTAPTAALTADKDTSILLHFDGAPGDTATDDDIIVTQDIRFGAGKTASKTTLADYSQFGCDLRSIGCAVEYGNQGVVADGQGANLRLFAINFNYVGSGGDFSNDINLATQGNEVVESNNASIYYVSIDQGGDFRVGDAFFVDQATGRVTFSETATDLTSLSSLTITDGTNASVITPTSGKFGNLQLSGNTLESTTGDVNIVTAGSGDVNVAADLIVTGIVSASGVNLDSIVNGDTSIALDDTGANGTIRFNTDGSEAGRFDNSNNLTVTNDIGAQNVGAVSTVSAAFFVGDGSKLTNISAGNVDLTGTYQSLAGVAVTGPGIALTVSNNADIRGELIVGAGISLSGNITGNTSSISGITSILSDEYYGNKLESTSGNDLAIRSAGANDRVRINNIFTFNSSGVFSASSSSLTLRGGGEQTSRPNIILGNGDSLTIDGGSGSTSGVTIKGGGSDGTVKVTEGDLVVTDDIKANGDVIGNSLTNISGIASVTADNFYGDGSGLTNISAGSVDLTGTYQSFAGIAVTGPGIALTVTNDVSIGGTMSVAETIFAQQYDSLSDAKLKDNIVVLGDALHNLEKLSGVSYVWKKDGSESIGVIAQEVREVYPQLVHEGENLTVNYNGLVGVLIRAVKELNAKVEDLQRQLDEK